MKRKKDRLLGDGHKQKLTNVQIYETVVSEGFDIGRGTINAALARIRKRRKEVYIRMEYDLGDRLEYDFGEVKLNFGEGIKVYYMAVLSSPGGGFRWLYLYENMKNVVTKFIGKNEKELNEDLVKMSMYYGFVINVTNCFKSNEKGHVEKSVDVLRNRIFAEKLTFESIDHAQDYANSRMQKLNVGTKMETEKFVRMDTVFYSVPEHLVGKKIIVKKYHNEIRVVCEIC